jgi:hypothetical protein
MVQLSPEHTMPPASGDGTDLADCCQRGPRTRSSGAMTNVEVTDDRRFWAVS